jgi:hypothetical protein
MFTDDEQKHLDTALILIKMFGLNAFIYKGESPEVCLEVLGENSYIPIEVTWFFNPKELCNRVRDLANRVNR